MVNFIEMSAADKQAHLQKMQDYLDQDVPQMAQAMTDALFHKGTDLIAAWPRTKNYIAERQKFRDEHKHLMSLVRWFNALMKEGSALIEKQTAQEQVRNIYHPGRPSREDAKIRAEIKAKQEAEAAKHPKLFEPSSKEKEQSVLPPSGGQEGVSDDDTAPLAQSESKLHLDQLTYLLSPALAESVTNLHALRSEFDEARTTAKVLATSGNKEQSATQAQLAHDLNEQITAIYDAVDTELAAVFIRIKNDSNYVAELGKKVKDVNVVKNTCRPYYKKVTANNPNFEQGIINAIKANSPEAIAKREQEAKDRKEVEGLLKYIKRTDKPATEKRLETLKTKYARLVELLGEEEAAYYKPFVDKCESDLSKMKKKTKTKAKR